MVQLLSRRGAYTNVIVESDSLEMAKLCGTCSSNNECVVFLVSTTGPKGFQPAWASPRSNPKGFFRITHDHETNKSPKKKFQGLKSRLAATRDLHTSKVVGQVDRPLARTWSYDLSDGRPKLLHSTFAGIGSFTSIKRSW